MMEAVAVEVAATVAAGVRWITLARYTGTDPKLLRAGAGTSRYGWKTRQIK